MTFVLDAALDALEKDFQVVLMQGKRPIFRNWQERPVTRTELIFRMTKDEQMNYGILLGKLSGVCVLDKDGRSAATTAFLKQHRATSPMEVLTKRGVHGYFRIPDTLTEMRTRIKWLQLGLDVKLTGVALGRGSEADGVIRRLKAGKRVTPKGELPFLPESLVTLLNAKPTQQVPEVRFESRSNIRNPKAYALRIESHQGFNGSEGLVRAVCVLRDAGVSSQEAFTFLVSDWNREPRVTPPWSEAEIAYAIRRHYQTR